MACLRTKNMSVSYGEDVIVVGWGTYAEEYNYTEFVKDTLQRAVFQVRDERDAACVSGDIGTEWDRNGTICAQGGGSGDGSKGDSLQFAKKKSTCYGDSGGPVLVFRDNRWILVGIVSFGHDNHDLKTRKKKCNASMPFYFVKVAFYFDWINVKTNFTLMNFQ